MPWWNKRLYECHGQQAQDGGHAHIIQGGHPHAKTKFPDFSLTKFSFSLTKILRFYDLFVFSQPINDKFPLLVH